MRERRLVRYLPAPSERMGALWALLSLGDLMILEYGPSGTTHYSMEALRSLGMQGTRGLYTTHMDQDAVVMGDMSALSSAIRELDELHKPKYLAVLGSSVSSLIGADITALCADMRGEISARLIPIDHCDFHSDFSLGLRIVMDALVEAMAQDAASVPGTFNILGVSPDAYGARDDAAEIARLMEEAFGWKLNAALPWGGGKDGFCRTARASINLAIRDETLPSARFLRGKYDTPYHSGMPYGYKGTLDWLEGVSNIIGAAVNPRVVERLSRKAEAARQPLMINGRRVERFAVIGVYPFVKGMCGFLEGESGLTPVFRICSHSPETVESPDAAIQFLPEERDWMEQVGNLRDAILFADDVSLSMARPSVVRVLASHPRILRDRTDNPAMNGYCGERGADLLYTHNERED
ncbi:MAG: nitrogenase component 1 [Oscillospiraceae bacterium]|jgi:nitrogenase molybdenum-cofactor synthesis protein NifE|nr:nitrogenase component 1 [Oscillospiraceae bacterium]